MSDSSFNLARLAKYLHLPEKQVLKLAERGEIPGRKRKGEWVFSLEEVNHWLEQRITGNDSEALASAEGVLARNAPQDEEEFTIPSLIPEGGIEIPLGARTKESALRSMCALAGKSGLLWDEDRMLDALRKREELMPTAMDNGLALLHPRRPQASILAESFLVLGVSGGGIPFGGGFGNLTNIFFLICATDERIHLRILARLGRMFINYPELADKLREAETPAEARAVLEEYDEKIPR